MYRRCGRGTRISATICLYIPVRLTGAFAAVTSSDERALNLGDDGAERRAAALPSAELAGLLRFSATALDGPSGLRVFDRAEVGAMEARGGKPAGAGDASSSGQSRSPRFYGTVAVSRTFSWRQPVSPAFAENAISSAPMTKSVAEYLDCARRFDRFAMAEPHVEVRRLLSAQVDACYRLAERRARETNAPIPERPIGWCLVARPAIASLIGTEGSGKVD
jgi:hypothetical protein